MIPSSLRSLRAAYRSATLSPQEVLESALSAADTNVGANVYLARESQWSRGEVARLRLEALDQQPLWGVPVSLKDCFDLSGFETTSGARVLAGKVAREDSAVAARLRSCGAVLTGKTHLHQLAYGITGENRDYGDCCQPGAPQLLTGGSSSGAAASVMEGSAAAAIGTDTGGSIRVPAALCGLVGYRGSWAIGHYANDERRDLWLGGAHLAPTFDTLGWLYRDAGDGPMLGSALFGLSRVAAPATRGLRVGAPDLSFLHDCEPEVLARLDRWIELLGATGAVVERFDADMWQESIEIFAPVQASEAARLHPEPRDGFEPVIAERLRWGATISADEIAHLRARLDVFRKRSAERLAAYEFLLLPCCPVSALRVGEDQSGARARILRYTAPVSLLGWPAVTLTGGGPQLIGKTGRDAELLALSAVLSMSQ
jgi:aspartyl-tRNA(Asn)/glutamyl-tRNA(Gln) amidotransferase subunit A